MVASKDGNLKTSSDIASLGDPGRLREAGEGNEGARNKDSEGPEGQEQEDDGEISGRRKVSCDQAIPASGKSLSGAPIPTL